MPYPSIDDLPWPVRLHLPQPAQEIYRGAFNNAWSEYAARGAEQREWSAHRIAWAAVKRLYRKRVTSGRPGCADAAGGPAHPVIDDGQAQNRCPVVRGA